MLSKSSKLNALILGAACAALLGACAQPGVSGPLPANSGVTTAKIYKGQVLSVQIVNPNGSNASGYASTQPSALDIATSAISDLKTGNYVSLAGTAINAYNLAQANRGAQSGGGLNNILLQGAPLAQPRLETWNGDVRVMVQMDGTNDVITVTQPNTEHLRKGQRVKVITGNGATTVIAD